jgi:hypothetical protein
VRADETTCPFCASGLGADFAVPPRPVVRAVGPFTRSAVLFLGATACGGSVTPEPAPVVFYGPAVVDASAEASAGDATADAGTDASAADGRAADADAADSEPGGPIFYGPAPVREDASQD